MCLSEELVTPPAFGEKSERPVGMEEINESELLAIKGGISLAGTSANVIFIEWNLQLFVT